MMSLLAMTMKAILLDFCFLICLKNLSARIVLSVIKKILCGSSSFGALIAGWLAASADN